MNNIQEYFKEMLNFHQDINIVVIVGINLVIKTFGFLKLLKDQVDQEAMQLLDILSLLNQRVIHYWRILMIYMLSLFDKQDENMA